MVTEAATELVILPDPANRGDCDEAVPRPYVDLDRCCDMLDEVYVVPVEGGEPKRLTWHPGEDIVRGFTADGKILFTSQRAVFSSRHSQFFTIGVTGGVPQALPVPHG